MLKIFSNQEMFSLTSKKEIYILQEYTSVTSRRIRCEYLSSSAPHKAKEEHFKTMKNIYYPCMNFYAYNLILTVMNVYSVIQK